MKSRHHNAVIAISLFVVFLATVGVSAQTIISAEQPEAILRIAKGFGNASLEYDSVGDPMISGRIEGTKYGISFYGCDDNGQHCQNILFQSTWSGVNVSMRQVNDWNANKRFGKAYLNADGDPMIEMVVNLAFGVTVKNFEDTFDWWKVALQMFKSEVLGQ